MKKNKPSRRSTNTSILRGLPAAVASDQRAHSAERLADVVSAELAHKIVSTV